MMRWDGVIWLYDKLVMYRHGVTWSYVAVERADYVQGCGKMGLFGC